MAPDARTCQLPGCRRQLGGKRPSARYCSGAHRTKAAEQRRASGQVAQRESPAAALGVVDAYASNARKAAAMAELAELELARQRGDLVPAKAVAAKLAETFLGCRTKLLAVPARYRERCPHLSLEDVALLEELQREALEDLAANGP